MSGVHELRWRLGKVALTAKPRRTIIRVSESKVVQRIPWDPRLHPRDPHGQFATSGSTSSAAPRLELGTPGRPLSDEEYQQHTSLIETRLAAALKAGIDTSKMYTLGGDGLTYTPERAAQQKAVLGELLDRYRSVPAERKAILSGGLGGAGKSTVLGRFAGVDQSQYATVNPDDIKEAMVRHGMTPKVKGLTPMEAATLFHEESTFIAQTLLATLRAQHKNIIFDSSMSWLPHLSGNLDKFKSAGYSVRAVFVDIPVEVSAQRALSRHREGLEQYRRGEDDIGGRYMPPYVIRHSASKHGGSINKENFEALKPRFDSWEIWDNSVWGRDPAKVDGSARHDLSLPPRREGTP